MGQRPSIYMDDALLEILDARARALRMTRSAVITLAVQRYLCLHYEPQQHERQRPRTHQPRSGAPRGASA